MERKSKKGKKTNWSRLDDAPNSPSGSSQDSTTPSKSNITQNKHATLNISSTKLESTSVTEVTDSSNSATPRDIKTSNIGSTSPFEINITRDKLTTENVNYTELESQASSSSEIAAIQDSDVTIPREMKMSKSKKQYCVRLDGVSNSQDVCMTVIISSPKLKSSSPLTISKEKYSSDNNQHRASSASDNDARNERPKEYDDSERKQSHSRSYSRKKHNSSDMERRSKESKKQYCVWVDGVSNSQDVCITVNVSSTKLVSSSRFSKKCSSGNNKHRTSSASDNDNAWNERPKEYDDSDRKQSYYLSYRRKKYLSPGNDGYGAISASDIDDECNENQLNKVSSKSNKYNNSERRDGYCPHSKDKQSSGDDEYRVSPPSKEYKGKYSFGNDRHRASSASDNEDTWIYKSNNGDLRSSKKTWGYSSSQQFSTQPSKTYDTNIRNQDMGRKSKKGKKTNWSRLDDATNSPSGNSQDSTSLSKLNITQNKRTTPNISTTKLESSSVTEVTDSSNLATPRDIEPSNIWSPFEINIVQNELTTENVNYTESKASSASEIVAIPDSNLTISREMKMSNRGKYLDKQMSRDTNKINRSCENSENKKRYSDKQNNTSLNFKKSEEYYSERKQSRSRTHSREKHSLDNDEYRAADILSNYVGSKLKDNDSERKERYRSDSKDKRSSGNYGRRVSSPSDYDTFRDRQSKSKKYLPDSKQRDRPHSKEKYHLGNDQHTALSASDSDIENCKSNEEDCKNFRKPYDRNSRNGRVDKSSGRKLNYDYDHDMFMKEYADKNKTYKIVIEVQGDLFMAGQEYSLGHCVAEDMNMGAGVAVTFRRLFQRVQDLLEQRQTQGGVAVLKDRERYIYYLVTNRVSSGKPTYYTLWCSLIQMKNHIIKNNVKNLALPRIGCGLGGLEWTRVKNMLEFLFRDVDIVIKIFNFQQETYDTPFAKVYKCPVLNVSYPIVDIEYGSVIIYFASEDDVQSAEMKSLCEKFPYIANVHRIEKKTVGTYIRTDRYKDGYCFYGCIVRKRHTDLFSFVHFQKCLNALQMQNRKDKYEFMAFQAFKENGDTAIVSKIVNLMRNSLTNVKVYVCWPKELQGYNNYQ